MSTEQAPAANRALVKITPSEQTCRHEKVIRVTGFCYDENRCEKCRAYLGKPEDS